MKSRIKKTIKFTTGVCAALGIVAIGAVVASSSAVKVVAEGLKAGTAAMKKTMAELEAEQADNETAESVKETLRPVVCASTEKSNNDDPVDNPEGEP